MTCKEIEIQIPDFQENRLSPAQRQDVETHLAGCGHCRSFAAQLEQLDATLTAGVRVPELSAGFAHQVQRRIQAVPATLSEAERAGRKRQLQAEFEAGLARIGPGWSALGNVLNHLIRPALAVLAGWLAWRFTLVVAAHVSAPSIGGLAPGTLALLVASAVFLAVGLAEAFPRQWKFLRAW